MIKIESILSNAIALAAKAHKDQRRWDGRPYILHPINVALKFLPSSGAKPSQEEYTMAIIGILHDVIEDTEWDLNNLSEELNLPAEAVSALEAITKRKDMSYEEYIDNLIKNRLASKVKMRDIEDNLKLLEPPENKELSPKKLSLYRKTYFKLKKTWGR